MVPDVWAPHGRRYRRLNEETPTLALRMKSVLGGVLLAFLGCRTVVELVPEYASCNPPYQSLSLREEEVYIQALEHLRSELTERLTVSPTTLVPYNFGVRDVRRLFQGVMHPSLPGIRMDTCTDLLVSQKLPRDLSSLRGKASGSLAWLDGRDYLREHAKGLADGVVVEVSVVGFGGPEARQALLYARLERQRRWESTRLYMQLSQSAGKWQVRGVMSSPVVYDDWVEGVVPKVPRLSIEDD